MKVSKYLILILAFLSSCESDVAWPEHSQTKEEALAAGSPVCQFSPEKFKFPLLDGTILIIDTAWTEVYFKYENDKRIYDSSNGFHFIVPFKKTIPNSFTFTFSLLDTNNRISINGIENKLCVLRPIKLKNEMSIILEQKDPDTSLGWTHPIFTDTIKFKKLL